ncbi:MAG TPA: phytase [Dongiaceae bacterium]|nr:phytase [Dongiaceae bacterium]
MKFRIASPLMSPGLLAASVSALSISAAVFMPAAQAADLPVVTAKLTTAPLHNYEDAPATPDGDDPAIWVNRINPRQALVITTAKDAGLLVYSKSGTLIQAILPPNAPLISATDPATPGGLNPVAHACPDSEEGETFGRFNNVDIAYGVRLGKGPRAQLADVAVVSDRGCDRIRFYRIDPLNATQPLTDITATDAARVYPDRYNQPSPLQPDAHAGWETNPVDDQNTVYGLTVAETRNGHQVFVTQRERGLIKQLNIVARANGTLGYEPVRGFLFNTNFELTNADGGHYAWTPCREEASEDPQSEGLVFDAANNQLLVAFETIGLYRLPLNDKLPKLVNVGFSQLIEPVKTFGTAYTATPDDGEFECEYGSAEAPTPDAIVAPGSDLHAGQNIEADLEGLSIVSSKPGYTLLLASSQGDSSFHLYGLSRAFVKTKGVNHYGAFLIDGVEETDGVHYVPVPFSAEYPLGTLVVQNGNAPEPADTGAINGYEYDGSTQFKYVSFADALKAVFQPQVELPKK